MTVNTQLAPKKDENTDLDTKPKVTKRLTKRQKDFIQNWVDPNSETFGNTYRSALKAGYSDKASRLVTANYRDLEWVKEAKSYMDNYSPLHIISGFQREASTAQQSRDRIAALDRLAKINGMYIDRSVNLNMDVKFTNSVPRPDTEPSNTTQ